MLVPPENFGLVEEGVYRCARLDPLNFAFLDTLGLKSLILLDAEKPPRALVNFFEEKPTSLCYVGRSGLKVIENQEDQENSNLAAVSHHDNPNATQATSSSTSYKEMQDWMMIRPNLIVEIFEIIFNKSKHNVMIVDKTEAIVGLLRKIQKWSFSSIISEYRLYAGARSTYTTETFLELIQLELVSFEENEMKKRDQQSISEEQDAVSMTSSKKDGIKMAAHRRSFSSRSSFSSISRSFEDLGIDSPEFDEFQNPSADELSLSASPQIPHELLKLAKQRKLKKESAKEETKALDPVRNNESVLMSPVAQAPSSFSLASRTNTAPTFMYHKSYASQFDNLTNDTHRKSIIKIPLPEDHNLPHWFISQRDSWESLYRRSNHI